MQGIKKERKEKKKTKPEPKNHSRIFPKSKHPWNRAGLPATSQFSPHVLFRIDLEDIFLIIFCLVWNTGITTNKRTSGGTINCLFRAVFSAERSGVEHLLIVVQVARPVCQN